MNATDNSPTLKRCNALTRADLDRLFRMVDEPTHPVSLPPVSSASLAPSVTPMVSTQQAVETIPTPTPTPVVERAMKAPD